MQKSTLFKLSFTAVWLVAASWMLAAPAPIRRGQLIHGAPQQQPAVNATVKTPQPAKKPVAVKHAPTTKPASSVKHAPTKKTAPSVKPAPTAKPVPTAKSTPPTKSVPSQPTASFGPCVPYRGAIAVDANTGRILFSNNMRRRGYPASVTKLMTFLLVLEDVQAGLYKLNDRATASVFAASMEPSKVDIRPGQSMTIDDLLLSIMVKSANDAAEVLAEHSALMHRRRRGAPTENVPPAELCAEFVMRMNERAKELGMRDTCYASPNGLPPPRGSRRNFDVSTAADLAELGKVLVRMPKALSYTSRASCKVTDGSGNPLVLVSHNYFLPGTYDKDRLGVPLEGCDGLKTGYTEKSGSSIMLTAHRKGRRVIVVVLGSAGRHEREKAAGHLLRDALDAVSLW